MVSTSKVLSDCLGTINSGVVNGFYAGVEALDGIDTWHQYISRKYEYNDVTKEANLLNVMTPSVRAQLQNDALMGSAPTGIFTRQRDIDPDSYYIARDNQGQPLRNKDGEVVFKYKATGQVVEWDKIPFKKIDMTEEKWYKKPLFWFYDKMGIDGEVLRKDQKRMVAAPIWYPYVKNRMLEYVKYGRQTNKKLMTNKGWDALEEGIKWFFINIENGKGSPTWYKTIYELFDGTQGNHWYLMSKTITFFDRIIEDPEYAKEYLGYGFSTNKEWRSFQETVAAYAGKATGSEKGVILDVIDAEYANEIYGQKGTLLYRIDDKGNVTYDPHYGTFNKNYFLKLSLKQQAEQLQDYFEGLGKDLDLNPTMTWIKVNLCYNFGGGILRFLKVIGNVGTFSFLMSFMKGFEGFMPLLILNSGMFATDILKFNPLIKGDWKPFFNKWGLNDGLPVNVLGYSSDVPVTLGDVGRKSKKLFIDAWNQGAYNINDSLMQNFYMVKKYEQFFLAIFPEVKTLSELDTALETMRKRQPKKFVQLLEAAKSYSEYAVRMSTTNTPISSTLIRVHPVQDRRWNGRGRMWQPWKDSYYSLYHFFAGWGYNKTKGAWTILKDGMNNILEGRIGAQYLDELLAGGDTAREAYAKMTRSYLENEDLLYLLNKVYVSIMIGKYLDRLSENGTDKDSETLFKDIQDMFSYMDVFSGEYAGLFANPTGRIYKTFFDTFTGELEHDLDPAHAGLAGSMAVVKEYFRSLFRKLYVPKMTMAFMSKVNAHWDDEEKYYLKWLFEAIQDESTGYLHFLRDSVENGGFSYSIVKGPNQHVRDILGMGAAEIEYIDNEQMLSKYANLFNGNHTFTNWILYSFPMFKQWNMNQLVSVNEFVDDLTKVRGTKAYMDMTNLKMPEDSNDADYIHLYNVVTGRLNWDLKNLNDDLSVDFTFIDEDTGELKYNKKRQIQEDLLYTVMQGGLSEEDAKKFIEEMSSSSITKQKAHAIETLAYIEANQPGSSYQALAYLMSAGWYDYVKEHNGFDKDLSKEGAAKIMEDAKIEMAKKYADYVGIVDKNVSWPQVMMFYLKTHDTEVAPYISEVGDTYNKTLKFITPGDGENVDNETNKIVYQNKILRQNFQAQLYVDILGAKGDINAGYLMNGYSLIFDTASYTREDGSIDPEYAAFTLNQLEGVWDHFNAMPISDDQKRKFKEGTLQFADNLLPWVLKDEKLMAREDVREVTQDWISFLYGEAKDLNDAARERAEDDLANSTWNKGRKNYKSFYKGGSLKYPTKPYTLPWHNYLTGRIKSLYSNYRIYDWTPRSGTPNYLSEADFEAAKRAQAQFMYHGENPNSSKKSSGGKSQDESIGVSSRRGKSIQFYKREDPDKPVEYKIPWRKRWVRRGSGTKPIATTTWKHLTPTPKR